MANDKANGLRLIQLLVDKGTQALRATFHAKHPNLAAVLNTNQSKLRRLKRSVINPSQWELLYPPSGLPDSQVFDVTLWTILFRNIYGLASPTTGWTAMPPDADTSIEANILRIKLYRNEVYAHIPTTEVDDNTFDNLWEKISKALVGLGIPKSEIDELKEAPLSPEEVQQLMKCKEGEEELIKISLDTNAAVKESKKKIEDTNAAVKENKKKLEAIDETLQQEVKRKASECADVSAVDKLGKCDFKGNIGRLCKSFQTGTRKWLFEKLSSWFTESDSRVMILTAGPGVGKSVFVAKVCQMYEQNGQLAACHFCKFNNSDYRNPHMLLQSLASHMCDNVKGFKEKLREQLQRPHSREKLPDAFRVLLNDPLYALQEREPMLVVIDALDESEVEGKSELLELISEEFPKLPKWIRILITSRPELPVQKELSRLNPIEIRPGDERNNTDLLHYFRSCLSGICGSAEVFTWLVWDCEGSFLYAYYVQLELLHENKQLTMENLTNIVPKGISGFYEKQFKRLKGCLASLNLEFKRLINVLVAAKGPLPLALLEECMGLFKNTDYELRRVVSEIMSSFLPVYDDCLTIYHKSLIDWLKSNGYSEHAFTADVKDGGRYLWCACEKVLNEIINLEAFSDLKLTPAVKYALEYGTSHLIDVGDESKYHWLLDIKLNHIKLSLFPRNMFTLEINCTQASDKSESEHLSDFRSKIWRLTRVLGSFLTDEGTASYLQSVANGLTPGNNDDECVKSIAKSMLEEEGYAWCEDLNTTRNFSSYIRAPWLDPIAKIFPNVGISPNKQLAAIGHMIGGTISILKLPSLELLYKYDSEITGRVPCCTFSPDNATLLYGSLGSCLDVEHRERMIFFADVPDQFVSCSFSSSGSRLVTADNTRLVKLWDVNNKILLTVLDAGEVVNNCFFSNCGVFIVGNTKYGSEGNVLAIWNVFTLQRMDKRSFTDKYLHNANSFPVAPSIDWFCRLRKTGKNLQIVVSGNPFAGVVFCQLPHGLPICRLRETVKYAVVKFQNRDCILTYIKEIRSFLVIDLVQQEVVAERRIHWLSDSMSSLVVVDEESFIVPGLPYFSFKTPDQLSFLSHNFSVTITCCSFSANGSCLATCDNHGIIRIWNVDTCKVTQTYTSSKSARACWWSKTCLWFVFSSGIARVPVTVKQTATFSETKIEYLESLHKFMALLSFLEGVLILKCDDCETSNCMICVMKVVDDELQPETILPTDHSFDSAAIGPGGCCIFLTSFTKYQLWKEKKSDHQVWCSFIDGNVPFSFAAEDDVRSRTSKCCISSDGLFGVLVGFDANRCAEMRSGCLVLDLRSGEIISNFIFPRQHLLYRMLTQNFYAGSSFLVFQDIRSCICIVRLKDGEVVAVWRRQGGTMKTFPMPILGFCSGHNLLAVPQRDGYINFVKIHGSQ